MLLKAASPCSDSAHSRMAASRQRVRHRMSEDVHSGEADSVGPIGYTRLFASHLDGQKTHIDDLALVRSNCHRIIHPRPWLSVADLNTLMEEFASRISIKKL